MADMENAATEFAWQSAYPDRYYVSYDRSAQQPTPPTGWFDMALYQTVAGFPAADAMLPLTEEQWLNTPRFNIAISDGKLITYTPPPIVIPLKDQAAMVLKTQQAYVMQTYAIYGDDTPPKWITYLKALRAIANGTDTTSTALPSVPS